jgi:hypothetical protein
MQAEARHEAEAALLMRAWIALALALAAAALLADPPLRDVSPAKKRIVH